MAGPICTQSTRVTQIFDTSTISGGILDRSVEDFRIHHPIISALLNFFGVDIKTFFASKRLIKEAEYMEEQIIESFNNIIAENKHSFEMPAGSLTKESVPITLVNDPVFQKTYLLIQGQVTDYLILNPLKRPDDYPSIEMRIPHDLKGAYTIVPIGIANDRTQDALAQDDKQLFTLILQYAISLLYIQYNHPEREGANTLLKRAYEIIHKSTGICDVLRSEYSRYNYAWLKLDPEGDIIPFIIDNANNLLDENYNSEKMDSLNNIIRNKLSAQTAYKNILESGPEDRGGVSTLLGLLIVRVLADFKSHYAEGNSFKQKQ